MIRMSMPIEKLPTEKQHYTYADYCTWDDGKRWEIIDGIAYAMVPGPTGTHQGISGNLHAQLHSFLKGKPCKVYAAPYDVRLSAEAGDDTVVQPDLVVICDRSKLSDAGCMGAPDLVVEILSPSTARYDRFIKFHRYLRAGVREYWIVDHESKTVTIHILENAKYTTTVFGDEDVAPVHVLEGCEINLTDVFAV